MTIVEFKKTRANPVKDDDILAMYRSGCSYREIAESLKCDPATVSRRLDFMEAKRTTHYPARKKEIPMYGKKDELYGKKNILAILLDFFIGRMVKNGDLFYFDGKLLRGWPDYHKLIKDMNRQKKSSGEPQIDYVKDWVV